MHGLKRIIYLLHFAGIDNDFIRQHAGAAGAARAALVHLYNSHIELPVLLKTTEKMGWLKTDFDKWKDEDDSDVEDNQDMDLSDVRMSSFLCAKGGIGVQGNG